MKTRKHEIDYTRIFPNSKISRQVINALNKSDRKMRYMEHDLKVEQPKKGQKEPGAKMQPAREDSFDRLLGEGHSFNSGEPTPEDCLMKKEQLEELYHSLSLLNAEEQALIHSIYFLDMTERSLAKYWGISQAILHKRKKYILKKLKYLLNFSI